MTYLSDEFRSEDRRHNVRKLLRLGWLLCEHADQKSQEDELWFLISPDMADSVPVKEVLDFVNTLVFFAININESK